LGRRYLAAKRWQSVEGNLEIEQINKDILILFVIS
jgi:hypothetical protein